MNERSHQRVTALLLALVALVVAGALLTAQATQKKVLSVEDYTKWRSISSEAISADGKWVAYVLQLTNTTQPESKPVLHLRNLDTNAEVTVADATGGTFSPDSQWIAYQVDPGAAQRARASRNTSGTSQGGSGGGTAPAAPAPQPSGQTPPAGAGQAPAAGAGRGGANGPIPPRRVELRNLASGEVRSWQDIESFTFAASSTHMFLRRRAPEASAAGGRGAGGGAPATPAPGGPGGGRGSAQGSSAARGQDVLLLELKTGRHQLLGSVGEIAFNRTGDLLAYSVESQTKDANGLFVFDTRSGRISVLDNDAKQYDRLAWNEEGNGIAVLKGLEVEKKREHKNVLMVFTDVRSAIAGATTDGDDKTPTHYILDPDKAEGFPKDWVISDRAALSWSEDNKRVFFGIKEQVAAPDTAPRKGIDEEANVDVWSSADERIQSEQMARADQERNFSFREAFELSARKFVKLADETMRDLEVAPDGKWAIGRDTRGYVSDAKPLSADIYRVNPTTGERTLILKAQQVGHVFGITPHGHHLLYWKDNRYQAYNLDENTTKLLGAATPSFVDTDYDYPGVKPPFGIAGYTSDGSAAIVYHKYDMWLLPFDGSAPRNLTNGFGAKNEIRFRYARTVPIDPTVPRSVGPRGTIDLTKPITLSAYGEWTKKAGFYELANGQLKELVYEDAAFSTPVRALKAEKYMFTRQTFAEFPDLRISGPDFKDSKKISDANPQQAEYLWGHRILFDYKIKDGTRLQGILAIPDDYKQGEKRPMIVTFYEKNSQNLNRYNAPSYITGMGASPMEGTSRGYLMMLADVHFHTGRSHSDMLEAVEAATRKVIEMGYADPKHIGVHGHSYGGEGAAFIGTVSKMFAAVADGAGVTDLYNDFSQEWGWSYHYSGGTGANGNNYYLFGQGRWGFSPWEKPEVYRYESALNHVPETVAPILIMHGTSDPTVNFYNGLGFYNALRYNKKTAYLLAYQGEGHGLRGLANRKDLTIRYFQFFDHFLKGTPAPKWMTDGVPFLKKDDMKEPK